MVEVLSEFMLYEFPDLVVTMLIKFMKHNKQHYRILEKCSVH